MLLVVFCVQHGFNMGGAGEGNADNMGSCRDFFYCFLVSFVILAEMTIVHLI